ncbi:MAG: AAA family ATPase [Cellvibrionaceae bacterium]|nr:AAA family ATPase [Cellvibrionaceae bacterium]
MYLEHFGLHKPPFRITPDTQAFYEGSDRGPSLVALSYAISQGEGITKVVGEVGTGKTMLCRMLPIHLNENIDWVYLAHPNLSPEHTLYNIGLELGLPLKPNDDKLAVMRKLHNILVERHRQGRQVVVLVEEAQNMPLDSLEEIRLLSNLETTSHKLLQIVLFGQPELDEKLADTRIRQMRERITYSLYLKPLGLDDIHSYLNFRMHAAGYRGPSLFTRSHAKTIAKHSCGLIRRVNIIGDKTLLLAYADNRYELTINYIRRAAEDSQYCDKKNWWQIWVTACLIYCFVNLNFTDTPIAAHSKLAPLTMSEML